MGALVMHPHQAQPGPDVGASPSMPDGAAPMPYFPPPLVMETVAIVFSTTVEAIRSQRKGNSLKLARAAAVALLREHTMLSWSEIARIFGRLDHSFGQNNLAAAKRLVAADPRFVQTLDQARRRLLQELHV